MKIILDEYNNNILCIILSTKWKAMYFDAKYYIKFVIKTICKC